MLILGFRSVEFQQTHQKISFLTINNLIIFKGNQQGQAGLCDSMNHTALKKLCFSQPRSEKGVVLIES